MAPTTATPLFSRGAAPADILEALVPTELLAYVQTIADRDVFAVTIVTDLKEAEIVLSRVSELVLIAMLSLALSTLTPVRTEAEKRTVVCLFHVIQVIMQGVSFRVSFKSSLYEYVFDSDMMDPEFSPGPTEHEFLCELHLAIAAFQRTSEHAGKPGRVCVSCCTTEGTVLTKTYHVAATCAVINASRSQEVIHA